MSSENPAVHALADPLHDSQESSFARSFDKLRINRLAKLDIFQPRLLLVGFLLLLGASVGFFLGKYFSSTEVRPKFPPISGKPLPPTARIPDAEPTDETANWKTYTNAQFQYSFQYPSDYKLYENQIISVDGVVAPQQGTVVLLSPVIPTTNSNFSIQITADQIKLLDKSLNSVVDQITTCSSINSPQGKPYILDGNKALLFEDTPCGLRGGTFIYVVHGNTVVIISVEQSQGLYSTVQKQVDQILSTFHFVN